MQSALRSGQLTRLDIARNCIERANGNASRNTYIRFEPDELLRDAHRPFDASLPLAGIPISLKDCFNIAGLRTTCGSRFYAEHLPPAGEDSAMAKALRRAGAQITGKTHLHPLAYGITGQNPEYGDCLQPRDATLLTGGSSSGAAASVQEGSALAAIGTDTGGSIRVPAALCGLVGYRASHRLASADGEWPEAWLGAAHLAPSFDTVGFLLRDPRDAAPIAQALFGVAKAEERKDLRIGFVEETFLMDSEKDVRHAFSASKSVLGVDSHLAEFATTHWHEVLEIFAGIQAHEAAAIHQGHYDEFEATIRDRLKWGASLSAPTLDDLQARREKFCDGIGNLFERFDLLMLPCAPVSRLKAGSDLSNARQIILRYTTPFSLAGLPALSLPGEMIGAGFGTGVQIAAAPGNDAMLLAFASAVGSRLAQR
jgi:Asp-tRNA(Asn)/Glu-tRNA(Gln) amidotransferase A subunit family amidase